MPGAGKRPCKGHPLAGTAGGLGIQRRAADSGGQGQNKQEYRAKQHPIRGTAQQVQIHRLPAKGLPVRQLPKAEIPQPQLRAARHQGGYAPADRRAANRRSGTGRPGAQQEDQRRAAQQPQVFQPRRQSQQPAHRHPVGAGGKAVQALHRGIQSRKAVQKPGDQGVDAVEQGKPRRGQRRPGHQLPPVDP